MRRHILLAADRLLPSRLSWAIFYLAGVPPVIGAEGPPPEPPAPPAPPEKTFNQDEVNAIVQERLRRDRQDRPSDDEIQELRDKAKAHDDATAANQSELEREKAAREAAEKAAADAAEAQQKAEANAQSTLRRSAIVAAAAQADAIDPEEVYALLANSDFAVRKDGNTLSVAIGDDGQVTGAQDAVTAFLEQKGHLVGTPRPPSEGGGGGPRKPAPSRTSDLASEDDPKKVVEAVKNL